MKFKTISMRIFVFVIPVITLTTLLFVWLSYYESNSQINETINERMQESLHVADLEIQAELYKNAAIAMYFAGHAKTMDVNTFDDEKHKNFLADGILSNPNTFGGGIWFEPYQFDRNSYYFGPFLYVEDGEVFYVPEYGNQVDYFKEDWYIKGEKSNNEIIWSKVYDDPVSKATMITATKPFYNEYGKFLGVGTADMNLENIRNIVNNISVGNTGRAFILGSNGEYISFYDEGKGIDDMMQADPNEGLAQLGEELISNKSGMTTFSREGKDFRVYYMTMENVNWTLAVTFEESEISSSAFNSFLLMAIIPILGLLFVVLSIFMVIQYLRRIINKVNSFADLAASGDLSKRIDVTETDEFGIMEQRLNKMISNMAEMSNHSADLLRIAEDANRSKSDFLSRMSHEIRTPMNAIIGMTQIAKTSGDTVRIHDCLLKIENASKHLLALINDILDMSKIEANKLELAEEEFDLEQSLLNIQNMMLVKTEEKKQRLTINVDKDAPLYIISDELRFSQIVTNLVGNAIKFTPEKGDISVKVSEAERNDAYSILQICVEDNGIGLDHEQQTRLFESFEQGDGGISRKFGGTGLGLAISKRIVELMNGRIWVTSEPGKGSAFTFTIRVRRGLGITKKQTEQLSKDKIKTLKILVVDDSVEANDYMEHILNSIMINCDRAYNGNEALTAVKNAMDKGQPYNIIFMDYMMPELNGIEAAKRIKMISDESTAIIMVSVYDWKDIQKDAEDAGVLKHITKPFSPSCVLDSINEVVPDIIKSNSSNISMDGFSGNTILLAEDMEINREIVAAFLEHTKVSIDFAENGIEAVEMFRLHPDKYDLILMDIQMPGMDGFEATKQIRQMDIKRAKTIPIVAMTANALIEDVIMCKEAGMNDHVAKPIEPDTLLMKLNDFFFMKDYLDYDIY